MQTLKLTLPLPPGVNNQYATVGRRRVLSKTAKSFRRDVNARFRRLFDAGTIDDRWLDTARGQNLACDIVYYFETPYRRDLDGGLKITLDAVSEALGLDDRYIVAITLEKKIDPLNPRTELELGVIPDWQFDESYVVLEPESATEGDRQGADDNDG